MDWAENLPAVAANNLHIAESSLSGGVRPGRAQPKMAEEIAARIEAEIMRRGWPEGEILGSEPSLIKHFGCSRAVFREAVRIVEHHGAARMRRGPGGGLVVAVPDPQAVQRPTTLYLDYANVPTSDLYAVRSALELTSVSQVATHLDEEGARRLRACIEAEQAAGAAGIAAGSSHNLHVLLAEMTGNVALRLFIETLAQLTFERTHSLDYDRQEVSETHAAHQAIVDAVIAGDAPLAQHRLRAHLAAALTYYQRREEPGADSPSSNEGTHKL